MARPPANMARPSQPPRLTEWPPAPDHFTADQVRAWERLGKAAMAAGTMTEADLLMAEYCAQVMARHARMLADPNVKPGPIAQAERFVKEALIQLGLTSASRKSVSAPGEPQTSEGLSTLLD